MRRYEVVLIRPSDVVVRQLASPEYFVPGDELALDGVLVLVYRVEPLPSGGERLICLPSAGDDPRVRVAA